MSSLDYLREEAEKTQVVIFAGGSGSRMASHMWNIPKPLVRYGDVPLIDKCISLYAGCGFRDFIALTGYGHEQVVAHVGDGSNYGVSVTCMADKKNGAGRGASLSHALKNGAVSSKRRSILTFPDDVHLDPYMPLSLLAGHLYGAKMGIIVTLAIASGHRGDYGAVNVSNSGAVTGFKEKPLIGLPTSVGTYVFEPAAFQVPCSGDSHRNLSSCQKVEIERELLPAVAAKRTLYAVFIQPGSWVPVDTIKDLII